MVNQIRTAARALMIRDGKILLIKMKDKRGVFFVLPGGGQRAGETLEDAVERECSEETGCEIKAGKLAYIREYIGRNHSFSKAHRRFHQLEAVFYCQITCLKNFGKGCESDKKQVGLTWVPLRELPQTELYPRQLKDIFEEGTVKTDNLYLGDIN
ncbi:MAG: NUDIX domain-containing protein [Verrucomicrobiota bacterium]